MKVLVNKLMVSFFLVVMLSVPVLAETQVLYESELLENKVGMHVAPQFEKSFKREAFDAGVEVAGAVASTTAKVVYSQLTLDNFLIAATAAATAAVTASGQVEFIPVIASIAAGIKGANKTLDTTPVVKDLKAQATQYAGERAKEAVIAVASKAKEGIFYGATKASNYVYNYWYGSSSK